MGAHWDEDDVNLVQANALGDLCRQAQTTLDATDAEMVAAAALCMFNVLGYGDMARRHGRDVGEELRGVLETVLRLVGEAVEGRYAS